MKTDTPIPPAPLALSPSKVADLACPHRYKKIHIEGVEEIPEQPMLVGGLVHEVASEYMNYLSKHGESHDLEELRSIIQRCWTERDPRLQPDEWPGYDQLAMNLQFRIVEGMTIAGTEEPIAFDKDWQEVEFDSPEVQFGGIPDMHQVEGKGDEAQIIITDWFCGGLGAEFESHKMMQLRFYAVLFWKKYGIDNVQCIVDSLRTGATKQVTLNRDDLEGSLAFMEAESAALANRDLVDDAAWPAQPCSVCERCQLDCPLLVPGEDGVDYVVKTNAKEFEILGSAILTERYLKNAKKLLKAYVALHGPIELDGMIAEARVSEKPVWVYGAARSLLVTLGYNPDEVGEITKTNLERKLSTDDFDNMMRIATIRREERFGVYKKKASQ